MRQLKVRFTVEHHNEASSFTSLNELKQQSYSNLLRNRIIDFESKLKQAAANVWLQNKLGASTQTPIEILITHEEADPAPYDLAQRA